MVKWVERSWTLCTSYLGHVENVALSNFERELSYSYVTLEKFGTILALSANHLSTAMKVVLRLIFFRLSGIKTPPYPFPPNLCSTAAVFPPNLSPPRRR
jgi:hypothetical protein